MKITSPEPKDYLGISGKGLVAYLCIKTIGWSKKNKKARYAITNVSLKDIFKILRDLKSLLLWVMYGRGPKMNLMTVTFI